MVASNFYTWEGATRHKKAPLFVTLWLLSDMRMACTHILLIAKPNDVKPEKFSAQAYGNMVTLIEYLEAPQGSLVRTGFDWNVDI